MNLNTISILKILYETLTNEECKNAINVEMHAFEKNQIWEVVDLPKEKRLEGCKWLLLLNTCRLNNRKIQGKIGRKMILSKPTGFSTKGHLY